MHVFPNLFGCHIVSNKFGNVLLSAQLMTLLIDDSKVIRLLWDQDQKLGVDILVVEIFLIFESLKSYVSCVPP